MLNPGVDSLATNAGVDSMALNEGENGRLKGQSPLYPLFVERV